MWKKKSTSIYLSKTLKKYQKRREPINYRSSLMTLYKKKSKESGGNEWGRVMVRIQPRQEPTPSEPQPPPPPAATIQRIVTYDPDTVVSIQSADGIQAADLLTQAMSELTQSLQEYRQPVGEYHVGARIGNAVQQGIVQVQAAHIQHPHSTIELSNLVPLSGTHFQTQNGGTLTPLQITLAPSTVIHANQDQTNPYLQ
ncbi:hypothetical protein FSP39_008752 [Pinctada imbricata]|uniref:Uncharacterized protein n=1 Tax=Pinctada imbricata TaxID=66713 RepID=A0AA88YVQ8_PINIB|nr:hypothetical protein FSP39_008752 [Pinctada imbricata]